MAAISVVSTLRINGASSHSFSSAPRSSVHAQRQHRERSLVATGLVSQFLGHGRRKLATSCPPGFHGRRRFHAITTSAFISPPAPLEPLEAESTTGQAPGIEGDREESPYFQPRKLEPVISWQLIMGLVLRHKLKLFFAAVALVAATATTLSMPIFSGQLFEVILQRSSNTLASVLGGLAIIYCVEPLATVLYGSAITHIWEDVMAELRTRLFQRLLILKLEFFDRHKVAELVSLLSLEVKSLQDVVGDNLSRDRGLRSAAEVVGSLCILWRVAPSLAPVVAAMILSVSVAISIRRRRMVPLGKAALGSQARMAEAAAETFGAVRTVRSFAGERRQLAHFNEVVQAVKGGGLSMGYLKFTNEALTRFGIYVCLLLVYCLGGAKIQAGELPVSAMVSFVGYTFMLTFSVQGLINTFGDIRQVATAVERLNRITSETDIDEALALGVEEQLSGGDRSCCPPPDPTLAASTSGTQRRHVRGAESGDSDGDYSQTLEEEYGHAASVGTHKGVLGGKYVVPRNTPLGRRRNACELAWTGDMCLEGVFFAYPTSPNIMVLKAMDLQLRRGAVTAIVGPSGSGKSTVVQLLSRFYEPLSGRITLAGHDARSFDKTEWARAIAVVSQEPVLFSTSVRNNIAYGVGEGEATEETIIAAAKAANAHDFVMKLPQGYDTNVGERGALLSGGQRQRIAIARAILKNAPILILDEATSALDSVNEQLVQDALHKLMQGRTTLVIAHRLSTVQSADAIGVLANGQVAELGTHAELLEAGGAYATLVNTQRLIFE